MTPLQGRIHQAQLHENSVKDLCLTLKFKKVLNKNCQVFNLT